jgi:hypothetical protein
MSLRVFGTESSETRSDVEGLALAASAEALPLDIAPAATAEMVVNTADSRITPGEIERPAQNPTDVVQLFPAEEATPSGPEAAIMLLPFGELLEALRDVAA